MWLIRRSCSATVTVSSETSRCRARCHWTAILASREPALRWSSRPISSFSGSSFGEGQPGSRQPTREPLLWKPLALEGMHDSDRARGRTAPVLCVTNRGSAGWKLAEVQFSCAPARFLKYNALRRTWLKVLQIEREAMKSAADEVEMKDQPPAEMWVAPSLIGLIG